MPGRIRTFAMQFTPRVTSPLTCRLQQKLKTHGEPYQPMRCQFCCLRRTVKEKLLSRSWEIWNWSLAWQETSSFLSKCPFLYCQWHAHVSPAWPQFSVSHRLLPPQPPRLPSWLPKQVTRTSHAPRTTSVPYSPELYLMRVFWEIFRGKEFSQWIRALHVGRTSKTWHWIWPLKEERKTKHIQCTPQFPILLPVLRTDLHFSPGEDMSALQKTQVFPSGLDLC